MSEKKGMQTSNETNIDPVELVGQAASRLFGGLGFRSLLGRLWTILFLSPEALDAEALREYLGVSTGSLNTSLRELIDMGLVYRQTEETSRRFLYKAENDLWLVITRMFKRRERGRFDSLLELLKQAENELSSTVKNNPNDLASFRLEQVRRLVDVGGFVVGLLDVFMARTKMELKAAQKWLLVSEALGGDPLGRFRRAINANLSKKKNISE